MVLSTNNILEYGWAGSNARMIIETKRYDPVKEQKAQEEGEKLVWRETVQYIDGSYKVEKNLLTFTPDKLDKFKKKIFKIVFKAKTQKVQHLLDEQANKYTVGECAEPIISIGM